MMKTRSLSNGAWLALVLVTAFAASPAMASSMTVTASQNPYVDANQTINYAYSAQAVFNLTGSTLTVTLTNTSTQDVTIPAEVLTALLFTEAGAGTLTPVSARVLNYGVQGNDVNASHISYWNSSSNNAYPGSSDGTLNGSLNSEWGYSAAHGISSSGLSGGPGGSSLFGQPWTTLPNITGHNTLWSPSALNGLQYGILPLADNPATGNGGLTSGPLSRGGVVFTFNVTGAFSLEDIQDISFQYGTCQCEPNIPPPPVPEPASMALLGIGVAALAVRKRLV